MTENQDELKTIDGDIALAYRLHRGSVVYEQPGKLRIEASIPHFVDRILYRQRQPETDCRAVCP